MWAWPGTPRAVFKGEAQEHWSESPIPSPADLPDPGIKPGSPALQAYSLLTREAPKGKSGRK